MELGGTSSKYKRVLGDIPWAFSDINPFIPENAKITQKQRFMILHAEYKLNASNLHSLMFFHTRGDVKIILTLSSQACKTTFVAGVISSDTT